MRQLVTLFSVFFISTIIMAQGQIINVPVDQPTIQGAINASVDGDTVLVADGTYYENINYNGKAITVASWFLIDGDETHIDSTIINGSQSTKPDSGSVVYFGFGVDTTSVLCGFTITGGTGSNPPGATHDAWGAGGIVIDAGAKIIYNKIVFNTVTSPHEYAYGGGILISPTKPVQINNNLISNNKVIGVSGEEGGGAGIFCAFADNTELLIADNIIINNSVVSTLNAPKGSGGAIHITHSSANPNIRNNLIKNNSARIGGGLKFTDYTGDDNPTLINNTIVNNHAADKGGAIYSVDPLTIINSILWGNTATTHSQIFSEVEGDVIIDYSNVEGDYEGIGNIDQDPLFSDTTLFYLTASSPCVDAGQPDGIFNDFSDPDNPGFPLFPAMGGLRNDMGAYGGNPYIYMNLGYHPERIILNCKLNNTYQTPGNDTLIVISEIFSPENQLVEVKATIESFDKTKVDSILMFDNGIHPDSIAGDGFFTGSWLVPNSEEDYNVHMATYLTSYDYSAAIKNAAYFNTKGPIRVDGYDFLSAMKLPNGGERIKYSLTLRNDGITDTVFDISVNIILPDNPFISYPQTGSFSDMAPQESYTNTFPSFAVSFSDSVEPGPYEFGIRIFSNNVAVWYDTFTFYYDATDVEDEKSNLPAVFALEQNYPNPFNPSTTIKYSIPAVERKASFADANYNGNSQSGDWLYNVTLKVYDILGREVTTLVNEHQRPGSYKVNFDASSLSSGVYFYKLTADGYISTRKMLLQR